MQTLNAAPPRIGKHAGGGLIQRAMKTKRSNNPSQPRCKKSGKYICAKKRKR